LGGDPHNPDMDAPLHQHETTIRVRYPEVDPQGVVHHSHYLVYLEIGRTELFRALGESYKALETSGTLLVVAETGIKYRRPAFYDDELTLVTRIDSIDRRGICLRFSYDLKREARLLATGTTTLAAVDRRGRLTSLPEALQARIRRSGEAGGVQASATDTALPVREE